MGRTKTVTRKPSYGDAVKWLASNDEAGASERHDPEFIGGLTTTLLAADLFGVDPRSLAIDIIRARHGAGRWTLDDEDRCDCGNDALAYKDRT